MSDVTSSIKNMIGGADPARQRAAEKLVEVQKKGGSFGEALRGGIQKYETARKDEAFNVETKRLLALESFEWTNLRTLMEEAAEQADAKGIKQKIALNVDKYLRGGTQTEQLEAIKKEVKNYLVVIDELTVWRVALGGRAEGAGGSGGGGWRRWDGDGRAHFPRRTSRRRERASSHRGRTDVHAAHALCSLDD